jgi:uncharacterized membrane protein HdeD (DUF308 family)
MSQTVLRYWWISALRGAIALAFGLLALLIPGIKVLTLVALFAVYALFGSTVWIACAINFLYPLGAGALALVWLVGLYAIATAALLLARALRLRARARRSPPPPAPSPS